MRYRPWRTKRGGRYLCGCGYKFWITEVNGHAEALLPEFSGPRMRNENNGKIPDDLKERCQVMRQWKEQTRHTGARGKHGAMSEQRRFGVIVERPVSIATARRGF